MTDQPDREALVTLATDAVLVVGESDRPTQREGIDGIMRAALAAVLPTHEEMVREQVMKELSVPAPHYRSYVDGNHCKACAAYVARKENDD